jgi:hypothetical protein
LVPIAAVGPENRLLGFVGLGSMAILAQLTETVFASAPAASFPRIWKGFAQAATLILLLVHLIAAPFLGIARIDYQAIVSSRMMHALATVPTDQGIASEDLVLINPPDHISLVTAIWAVRRLDNLPMPRHLRALSSGGPLEITRVGPRSIQMRFPGGFFPTAYSRFLRSPNDRFSVGQRIMLPGLSVTLESLDKQGDPSEVLYEFPMPLENPSLRWMRWNDGGYVPWSPPQAGETVRLPAARGIY